MYYFCFFKILTYILGIFIELVAGVLYPAQQTLHYLKLIQSTTAKHESKNTKNTVACAKVYYWGVYWILLGWVHWLYTAFWFLPFAYETKLILTLTLSHPKIHAPQSFIKYVIQNPRVKIKVNAIKEKLEKLYEKEILPRLVKANLIK